MKKEDEIKERITEEIRTHGSTIGSAMHAIYEALLDNQGCYIHLCNEPADFHLFAVRGNKHLANMIAVLVEEVMERRKN